MKKFIALILAALMLFGFTACGIGQSETVESINIESLLNKEVKEAKELIGMTLRKTDDTDVYRYYSTGNYEWDVVVDDSTGKICYAAYTGTYTTVNGLKLYMNYDEAADALTSNGYEITKEATKNNLFFEKAGEEFVGLCTFDPEEPGTLLSIQVDLGTYTITNWAKDENSNDTQEEVSDIDSTDKSEIDSTDKSEIADLTTFIGKDKDSVINTFDGKFEITKDSISISMYDFADFYLDPVSNKVIGCGFNYSEGATVYGMTYGMEYEEAKAIIQKLTSDIYEYQNCIYATTSDDKYIIAAVFDDTGIAFDGNGLVHIEVFTKTDDLCIIPEHYFIPFAIFGSDLELADSTEKQDENGAYYTVNTYTTKNKNVKITLGNEVSIIGDCDYNICGAEYGMTVETAKKALTEHGFKFSDSLTAKSDAGTVTLKTDSNNCISEITLTKG